MTVYYGDDVVMRRGRSWRVYGVTLMVWILSTCHSVSQPNSGFDVRLDLNYDSAERTIELYEGRSGVPSTIAALRGNQIAATTTGLLARRALTLGDLERELESVRFGHPLQDDVFKLGDAREHAGAIKELLAEIRRRNFNRRVASTVEQFFPAGVSISTAIPVYFVACGHHNIDAYVHRIRWHGDTPVFVGEGEGDLTIVVNLAKAVYYGRTVDERFIGTLSVVAHEVFHAAFGVYKDSSPAWREHYSRQLSHLDRLLDLTQNEGIAHFLTFEQRTGGHLPRDWNQKVNAAFNDFNRNAEALVSGRITHSQANELIRKSNTSAYWESYGAITGLFIARQIDGTLGRTALAETITKGPFDFYRKYAEVASRNSNLPPLSDLVMEHLNSVDPR